MAEQSPAGWDPVDGGRLRWWDGAQWTEEFRDLPVEQPGPEKEKAFRRVAGAVAGRVIDTRTDVPADALWSATGKPISGIGAGRYWMSSHHLFFEKGTLRTDSQQVPISAVVDVDVKQTMTQKARGVFTVLVHIQRAHGIEVVTMDDIPDGREAMRTINAAAAAARLAIQRNANTMRYEGQAPFGPPPMAPPPSTPPPPPAPSVPWADDPMEQLRKLAELKDAGILTEEEFTAKKAEILSRL
jgi:hypothetical protein